jgi:hypothetical protein
MYDLSKCTPIPCGFNVLIAGIKSAKKTMAYLYLELNSNQPLHNLLHIWKHFDLLYCRGDKGMLDKINPAEK